MAVLRESSDVSYLWNVTGDRARELFALHREQLLS
jgi:hypothetical protein